MGAQREEGQAGGQARAAKGRACQAENGQEGGREGGWEDVESVQVMVIAPVLTTRMQSISMIDDEVCQWEGVRRQVSQELQCTSRVPVFLKVMMLRTG